MALLPRILTILFAFLAGLLVMQQGLWPSTLLHRTAAYFVAVDFRGQGPVMRIENDLDIAPHRHLMPSDYAPPPDRPFETVALPGMRERRPLPPRVFIAPERRPALTVIAGAFDLEGHRHAALLLGPDGRVLHLWPMVEPEGGREQGMLDPDGFEVLPDGTEVKRIDACGEPIWARPVSAHHSVALDGDGALWTWDYDVMIKLSVEDGALLKRLGIEEIAEANPGIDLFGIRQIHTANDSRWLADPWHPNDADPLPADLAHAFHEHWEKRIRDFDPKNPYQPSLMDFTKLMIQEQGGQNNVNIISQARNLFDLLWNKQQDPTQIEDDSLYEHYHLRHRDPLEYFERGQIFTSFESDDPAPAYLPQAMGEIGKQIACFSGDYGHWDGVLEGCVSDAANIADYDRDHLARLLGGNALDLYGQRLRNALPEHLTVAATH